MFRSPGRIMVAALLAAFGGVTAARAQTSMTGELGADLETYGFENRLKTSGQEFGVDRAVSNQFLDLRLTRPLFSPELLHLEARTLFEGTYYHVAGEGQENDVYFDPSLPTYHGALSLFPSRRYPLRLYLNRTRDHSLRYEAQNRSRSDLASPELAVVRSYRTDLGSRGLQWKLGLAENLDFGAEVGQDRTQVRRRFDFDENRDIWVDFVTFRPDPTAFEHRIEVLNELPGDTLLLFVDLLQVDEVLPGTSVTFDLESGRHEIEIVPRRLNAFRTAVDVQGDMRWRVLYTPPSGSSDVDQTTNAVVGTLDYGGAGPFKNEAYYEYNDTGEEVQNRTTYLTNFSNHAGYAFSRFSGLDVLTSYMQNDTDIDTVSSQLSRSFLQQNTLRLGSASGRQTRLSYAYNWLASRTDVDDFESRSHILGAAQTVPVTALRSTLDWRNTATFMADNRDYANDQYVTDLSNTTRLRYLGVDWQPREQIKYTASRQENPDHEANELETRGQLIGDLPRAGALGQVKVKGEISRRRKDEGDEIDIKHRYLAEMVVTRRFGRGTRLMLSTSQEKETYDLEVSGTAAAAVAGAEARVNPARQDEVKQGYKLDLIASPLAGLSLGANAMLIKQNDTRITRLGASANGRLPALGLPVRWFLLSERRELEGLPEQTNFTMETRLSYRFRQVVLTVSHRLMREDLVNEKYSFQELRAEISRQFTVLTP